MKWTKASERLPEKGNEKYVCKAYNEGTKKIVTKVVWFSLDKVFESRLQIIEWLDESEEVKERGVVFESSKDKERIASLEKEEERLRGVVGKAMEWVSISTLFFDEETNSWDDLFIKGTPCTTPELVELFLKENKQP